MNVKKIMVACLVLVFLCSSSAAVDAPKACIVYFTGIGCPHCAKADPIVLRDFTRNYNDSLVIIEYEIYRQQENAEVMYDYNTVMETGFGIPKIVFGEVYFTGDSSILDSLENELHYYTSQGNPCPLLNSVKDFSSIDLNSLPGKPNIWMGDRILIKKEVNSTASSDLLKELLYARNLSAAVEAKGLQHIEPCNVPISGGEVVFTHAVEVDGWLLEWDGSTISSKGGWMDPYLGLCVFALLLGLVLYFFVMKDKKRGG